MSGTHEEFLEALRPTAFAIGYRMLGSVAEAEDVVQEALLRLHEALNRGERIESPRAYLATVATRLAIDQLRSARVRRETYVGEWLPEPLVTDSDADPARQAELADSLSMAFLVLLESLSPEQRAALLLHDVSTTTTRRSPRSSARARTTRASSPPERAAMSRRASHASRRQHRLLDGLEVGQDHLGLDRRDVTGRIHLAVDVADVLVAEDPRHLADRGRLPDVREEPVAEALTLAGAAHDAGDVHELDGGGDDPRGVEESGERREPRLGHPDHADVGLDGRERVVGGQHVVLGQRVEQRRLARVGEPDDSDGECHGRRVYGRAGAGPNRRPAGQQAGAGPSRSRSRSSSAVV